MLHNKLANRHFRALPLLILLIILSTAGANGTDFDVSSTGDSGPQTLRQAIIDANADGNEPHNINFSITGTIRLTTVLPEIECDVNINGPGADLLTVERDIVRTGFRILHFGEHTTSTLFGLTIAKGLDTDGAGIKSEGHLTVNACWIQDNHATIVGAGIHNLGSIDILDSTFSGNSAPTGAALCNLLGLLGTMNVTNSTFSDNETTIAGGSALLNDTGAECNMLHCTVTNNRGGHATAAVVNLAFPSRLNLRNTIIANNTPQDLANIAFAFLNSEGNNLIGDNSGVESQFPQGLPNGSNDLVGTSAMPLDPGLLPLGAIDGFPFGGNTGPTPTHPLDIGSPAVDGGNNMNVPATDQRGQPRIADGDCDNQAIVDIGSFERRADTTSPIITCPNDITELCTSAAGSVVMFTPTATDNFDPAPIITCTPESGSVFAPGTTPVTCTAIDACGNMSNCTFEVTIIGNPADVFGEKTVVGEFIAGGRIQYTVILNNESDNVQPDNPGDEFTDILPEHLRLDGAMVIEGGGAVDVDLRGRIVNWNGTIPARGRIIILIDALILFNTLGETICNQGTVFYDGIGCGANTTSRPTHDPTVLDSDDSPTCLMVPDVVPSEIPSLGSFGVGALSILMGMMLVVKAIRFRSKPL